jgi:hypothetical protein
MASYAREGFDSGQSFITGNEFDFSGLYLRDAPPHFGKLFGSDVCRNILRQAFYQSLREFSSSIRRQSHRITKDFFEGCHDERLLCCCGLKQGQRDALGLHNSTGKPFEAGLNFRPGGLIVRLALHVS